MIAGIEGFLRTGLRRVLWCVLLCLVIMAGPDSAFSKDLVYGTGDGLKVTETEVDAFKKYMVPGQVVPTQKDLLRVILNQRLFAAEAETSGLSEDPETKTRVDLVRQKALAEAYARRYLERELKIDDQVIESYYLSHLEEFTSPGKIHLFRLVVKDGEKAKELLEAAKKAPDSFPELVKAHSVDPVTWWKDGDMGMVDEARLKPEIRTALEGLSAGGVAGPLELHGFYYIFWIKDVQPEVVIGLDKLRDQLREKVESHKRQEVLQAHSNELAEKYHFRWQPEVLKDAEKPAVQTGK
jgi:parvulin-like peptidyl-prolyl isomerase